MDHLAGSVSQQGEKASKNACLQDTACFLCWNTQTKKHEMILAATQYTTVWVTPLTLAMVPWHQVFNMLGRRSLTITSQLAFFSSSKESSRHKQRSADFCYTDVLVRFRGLYSKWKINRFYTLASFSKLIKSGPLVLTVVLGWQVPLAQNICKDTSKLVTSITELRKGKSDRCWLHLFIGDAEEQLLLSGFGRISCESQ